MDKAEALNQLEQYLQRFAAQATTINTSNGGRTTVIVEAPQDEVQKMSQVLQTIREAVYAAMSYEQQSAPVVPEVVEE